MSGLPRPSGIKPPSKIGRPSGLPSVKTTGSNLPSSTPSSKAHSAIAKSARGIGYAPSTADRYANQVTPSLKGPAPSEDGSVANTDDFKIGDRVWVSGTKPGMIAFIGETQFAPGEWAGIVLDEPIGKNDGSVMNVRYFQCEAKRGVFSRLSKLSHTQQSPSRGPSESTASSGQGDGSKLPPPATPVTPAITNGTTVSTTSIPSRPSSRLGMSSSKHLSTSSSSLHKSPGATPAVGATTTAMRLPSTTPGGVKVGDKVLVSGSKLGTLRYIGETDFAKGVWAGVELDDALGKNDGAVAGKRYFDCKPLHGLFAPVHKISRAGSAASTPSPHSRPLMSTSLRSSRERSGSQESVSSISSTASSVSRSRNAKTGQRPSTLNLSATSAALQKALKEKEEHIEQLLRERDLERSEVARAAAQVDEAEGQLSSVKTEKVRLQHEAEEQISQLRESLAQVETDKTELSALLEEEKRKVEDLQFQLEEEALKEDGDEKGVDEFQFREMERQAKKEKERADRLDTDLQQLKSELDELRKTKTETDDAQVTYLDQIEELTYKLTQSEQKLKTYENSRLEDGAKTNQANIELAEKTKQVNELEQQLAAQKRELSNFSQQLAEVREELKSSEEKRKKQDEHLQELSNKVRDSETEQKKLADDLRNSNSQSADLQRQLSASQAKAEQLTEDRGKLEEQLSELVKNSGDSSSQLTSVTEQLQEKNRKLEEVQSDLLNSSQKTAKLEEELEQARQDRDRQVEELRQNHQGDLGKLEEELAEHKSSVEKLRSKLTQQQSDYESERKEFEDKRREEVEGLQQQVKQQTTELEQQKVQTEAHKQMLDNTTSHRDTLQHEKQQLDKQLKRLEAEKDSVNTELIQTKVTLTKLEGQVGEVTGSRSELEDQIEKLKLELDCTQKAKSELEKQRDEAKSVKQDLSKERDTARDEVKSLREGLDAKDERIQKLTAELEQLQNVSEKKAEELMQKSQTEVDFVKSELESTKHQMQEIEMSRSRQEEELLHLQELLDQTKKVQDERDMLAKEKVELLKEKEETEDKCRSFIHEVEKQSNKAGKLEAELKKSQEQEDTLRQDKGHLESKVNQLMHDLDIARHEVKETKNQLQSSNDGLAGDEMYVKLKEEADQSKGQVDFLNSVIVELQNKNYELQQRLAAMEDSGIQTNGDIGDSDVPATNRVPPRLYCDICEMFDLHDTEECPKQSMSASPEPTRAALDPKNIRPYCEICETFYEWCECGAFQVLKESEGLEASKEKRISDVKELAQLKDGLVGVNDFSTPENIDNVVVSSLDIMNETENSDTHKSSDEEKDLFYEAEEDSENEILKDKLNPEKEITGDVALSKGDNSQFISGLQEADTYFVLNYSASNQENFVYNQSIDFYKKDAFNEHFKSLNSTFVPCYLMNWNNLFIYKELNSFSNKTCYSKSDEMKETHNLFLKDCVQNTKIDLAQEMSLQKCNYCQKSDNSNDYHNFDNSNNYQDTDDSNNNYNENDSYNYDNADDSNNYDNADDSNNYENADDSNNYDNADDSNDTNNNSDDNDDDNHDEDQSDNDDNDSGSDDDQNDEKKEEEEDDDDEKDDSDEEDEKQNSASGYTKVNSEKEKDIPKKKHKRFLSKNSRKFSESFNLRDFSDVSFSIDESKQSSLNLDEYGIEFCDTNISKQSLNTIGHQESLDLEDFGIDQSNIAVRQPVKPNIGIQTKNNTTVNQTERIDAKSESEDKVEKLPDKRLNEDLNTNNREDLKQNAKLSNLATPLLIREEDKQEDLRHTNNPNQAEGVQREPPRIKEIIPVREEEMRKQTKKLNQVQDIQIETSQSKEKIPEQTKEKDIEQYEHKDEMKTMIDKSTCDSEKARQDREKAKEDREKERLEKERLRKERKSKLAEFDADAIKAKLENLKRMLGKDTLEHSEELSEDKELPGSSLCESESLTRSSEIKSQSLETESVKPQDYTDNEKHDQKSEELNKAKRNLETSDELDHNHSQKSTPVLEKHLNKIHAIEEKVCVVEKDISNTEATKTEIEKSQSAVVQNTNTETKTDNKKSQSDVLKRSHETKTEKENSQCKDLKTEPDEHVSVCERDNKPSENVYTSSFNNTDKFEKHDEAKIQEAPDIGEQSKDSSYSCPEEIKENDKVKIPKTVENKKPKPQKGLKSKFDNFVENKDEEKHETNIESSESIKATESPPKNEINEEKTQMRDERKDIQDKFNKNLQEKTSTDMEINLDDFDISTGSGKKCKKLKRKKPESNKEEGKGKKGFDLDLDEFSLDPNQSGALNLEDFVIDN